MADMAQALAWASRNLRIFPLPYGEKRPNDTFPELATTDPERIRQLWRDPINGSKELNIGVLCGNGTILFDIDTKYDLSRGQSAMANYIQAGGHLDTLVVKTASGGYQAYFKLPNGTEYANAVGVVPGVDVRCQNGYGIAPGSFSITSGGEYELFNDQPIAEIPAALVPLLKPVKSRKERLNGHADEAKAIPAYIDYLTRVEPAIEGQGGDAQTYNVACMGVVDYGLSVPTVANLLRDYYNPRCIPPWDYDDLIKKAENADAYHKGPEGSKNPDTILSGLTYHAPAVQALAAQIQAHIDTEDSLLVPEKIPLTQWLMKPFIAQGVTTVAVGPGGVGKSTFLIGLLANAALGKDFGPYSFKEPIESMLYSPEDDRPHISGRASVTCRLYNLDYKAVAAKFKVFDQHNETVVLAEYVDRKVRIPPETIVFLTNFKNKYPNCRLMVFDPFRKVLRGIPENDNTLMSEAMKQINGIANALNVAILLTHHTPKNFIRQKDADTTNPDAASGAGSIVTSARIVVNIMPQTQLEQERQGKRDDTFSVTVVKNNHGPSGQSSWWQRRIMQAPNGEDYPASMPTDVKDAMARLHRDYVYAIGDYMLERDVNALSVTQAAIVIHDTYAEARSPRTIAETLRTLFKRGDAIQQYMDIFGNVYSVQLDMDTGKAGVFVLVPMPGVQYNINGVRQ